MTYKLTTTIFFNYCFDKRKFQNFLHWFFKKNYYGQSQLLRFLEKLKFLGFHSATQAGFSISIEDLKIPYSKSIVLATAENNVLEAEIQMLAGNLTQIERYQRIIEIWNRTSENLKFQVLQSFQFSNLFNPVYLMAFSGARGNISQIRQLVGMRGLMANPQGQIIDFPIRSNFREGLTLTEYLISCSGARKGIVDTALRTAASGYLTRRLVDVAHHVIISQIDCQAYSKQAYSKQAYCYQQVLGIPLEDLYDRQKKVLSLHQRLIGRILAENIVSPETSLIIGEKNKEISKNLSQQICNYRKKVLVRSPLTCQSSKFICQLCYGWNLAEGQLVSIGEAVGVLAAQAIGEPGTQLTMRTFHTGGVFTGILMDQISAPFSGTIKYPISCHGILIRTQQGKIAYLSKKEGTLIILPETKTNLFQFKGLKGPKKIVQIKKNFNIIKKNFNIQFNLKKESWIFRKNNKNFFKKKPIESSLKQLDETNKIKKYVRAAVAFTAVSRLSKPAYESAAQAIDFRFNKASTKYLYNNKLLLYKLEKLSLNLKTIRLFNKTWLKCISQKQTNLNQHNLITKSTYVSRLTTKSTNLFVLNVLNNIFKSYKKSRFSFKHNKNAIQNKNKYYLQFKSSTLLYTRQNEKILQAQLIAEIPYIDYENSVENEQEILSSISGEVHFENFIFIERTFQDFKTIPKISENFLQNLGEFWILFGQSFKNFLIPKILTINFLKKSDLIDELTPFTQIAIESTNLLTETQFSKLDTVFLQKEQLQLFFSNFPKKQKFNFRLKNIEKLRNNLYLQKSTQNFQLNFIFFKNSGYIQTQKTSAVSRHAAAQQRAAAACCWRKQAYCVTAASSTLLRAARAACSISSYGSAACSQTSSTLLRARRPLQKQKDRVGRKSIERHSYKKKKWVHWSCWLFRKNNKNLLTKNFKTWIIGLKFHSKYVFNYSDKSNQNLKVLIKTFQIKLKRNPTYPNPVFKELKLALYQKESTKVRLFKQPKYSNIGIVTLKRKNNFFLSDIISSYKKSNKFFYEIFSNIQQSRYFGISNNGYFFQENLCIVLVNRQGILRSFGQTFIKKTDNIQTQTLSVDQLQDGLIPSSFNLKIDFVHSKNLVKIVKKSLRVFSTWFPRVFKLSFSSFLNIKGAENLLFKNLSRYKTKRILLSYIPKKSFQKNQPIIIEFKQRYWSSKPAYYFKPDFRNSLKRKNNFQKIQSYNLSLISKISQKWFGFTLLNIPLPLLTAQPLDQKSAIYNLNNKKIRSIFYNFFLQKSLFLQSFPKKWFRKNLRDKSQIIHWQYLSNYKYLFLIFVLQYLTFNKDFKKNNIQNNNLNNNLDKTTQFEINEIEPFYKLENKKENSFSELYYFYKLKKRQKILSAKNLKIGSYVFIRIFICIKLDYFNNIKKFKEIVKNLYKFLTIPNCSQKKVQNFQNLKKDSLYLCSSLDRKLDFCLDRKLDFCLDRKLDFFFRSLIKKFTAQKFSHKSVYCLNFFKPRLLQFELPNNLVVFVTCVKKEQQLNISLLKDLNILLKKTIIGNKNLNKTSKIKKIEKNSLFSKFIITGFLKIFLFCIKQQPAEKKIKLTSKKLLLNWRKTQKKSSNSRFVSRLTKPAYENKQFRNNSEKLLNIESLKFLNNSSIFYTKSKTNLQNIHLNGQYNGLSLILNTFCEKQTFDLHKWEFFSDCQLMLEKSQYSTYFKNFIKSLKIKNDFSENPVQFKNMKKNKKWITKKKTYTYYRPIDTMLNKTRIFTIDQKNSNFKNPNFKNPSTYVSRLSKPAYESAAQAPQVSRLTAAKDPQTSMFFLDKILPQSLVSPNNKIKKFNILKNKIYSSKLQKTIFDFYFTSYNLILINFSFIKNFRRRFCQIDPRKPILNALEYQTAQNQFIQNQFLEQLYNNSVPNKKNLQTILLSKTLQSNLTSTLTPKTNGLSLNIQSFLNINPSYKFYTEYISKKSFLLDSINKSQLIKIKNFKTYSIRYLKSQIIKQKCDLFQNNPILFSINALVSRLSKPAYESAVQKIKETPRTKLNFTWFLLIFYQSNNFLGTDSLRCWKLAFVKKNLDNFFSIELTDFKKLTDFNSSLTNRIPFKNLRNDSIVELSLENPFIWPKIVSNNFGHETSKNGYQRNSNNFYNLKNLKNFYSRDSFKNLFYKKSSKKVQFKIFRILKIIILQYFYFYNSKNNFKNSSGLPLKIRIKEIKPNNNLKCFKTEKSHIFQNLFETQETRENFSQLFFHKNFEIKLALLNKTTNLLLLGISPLTKLKKVSQTKQMKVAPKIFSLLDPSYKTIHLEYFSNLFSINAFQSTQLWQINKNTQCLQFNLNQSKIVKLLSTKNNLNILKFKIIKKIDFQAVETQLFIRFFLPFTNHEIVDCIEPKSNIQSSSKNLQSSSKNFLKNNEIQRKSQINFEKQRGLLVTNLSDFFAYSRTSFTNLKFQKTFKNSTVKKSRILNTKFLPFSFEKSIGKKSNSFSFLSFSITKKSVINSVSKKKFSHRIKSNNSKVLQLKKGSSYLSKYCLNRTKVCLAQNILCSLKFNSFNRIFKEFQYFKIGNKIGKIENNRIKIQLGSLIRCGDKVSLNKIVMNSGQIIAKTQQKLLFRRATTYLLNKPSILHVKHGELISKNQRLYSIFYNQSKTGDIVQGIPKIEEIFEARKKSKYRLNELSIFSKDFLFFDKKISQYLQNLQQSVVNNIQRIYCGQGVHISDKHIEIIVRQMTSNVLILEPGQTGLLCGEVVALQWISRINSTVLSNPIIYEPLLMGMTKTCLETSSFLSAASFQETTHILSRAALQNQIDFIRGLKQNVILGNLIPIGTGCF